MSDTEVSTQDAFRLLCVGHTLWGTGSERAGGLSLKDGVSTQQHTPPGS